MSLITDLKGRVTAKVPSPAEIISELTLAEAALADLEARHGGAALDAMSGTSGADATLRDLEQKLAGQRQRVQTLRAAHTAAVRREEETIQAQRASLQKAQRAACLKALAARDIAATALSEAVVKAAEHYHGLLDYSAKAQAACPALMVQYPDGALCDQTALRRLVSNEFYRVSAAAGNRDGRALPGSALPGTEFEWNPNGIPAMVEQVKTASAFIATKLTGKAKD